MLLADGLSAERSFVGWWVDGLGSMFCARSEGGCCAAFGVGLLLWWFLG